MQVAHKAILALDVGEKRIGVAIASNLARLARPLTTLKQSSQIMAELQNIIDEEDIGTLVVGLPRGLESQETAQTKAVKVFAEQLKASINLPLFWQDEALTSLKAQAEINSRRRESNKSEVDALAATYILEDFLIDNPVGNYHG